MADVGFCRAPLHGCERPGTANPRTAAKRPNLASVRLEPRLPMSIDFSVGAKLVLEGRFGLRLFNKLGRQKF